MRPYVTAYCNRAHDLADGKPIEHQCRILPPEALKAEQEGDHDKALAILEKTRVRFMFLGKRLPK